MPDEEAVRRRVLIGHWPRVAAAGALTLMPLAGGSESAPWLVCRGTVRYVLRHRHRTDGAEERLVASLAAQGAAWRRGVAAPRPLPTDTGEAYARDGEDLWALGEWVPGRPRRRWGGLTVAQAHALGMALAALHAALRDLPPDVAGAATGPVRRRGRPQDQVLHGDPTQGNVLWRQAAGRPRVGFIDFDRVGRGAVELDLARALVGLPPWAEAGPPRLARALLTGYAAGGGAVRPGRLAPSIGRALDEGERWLAVASLSASARRNGERWLVHARAVRLGPQTLAPASVRGPLPALPGNGGDGVRRDGGGAGTR